MAVLVTVLVLVCMAGTLEGHRYGADLQACDTMKPGHGATVRQTRRTPYVIETNNLGYRPCTTNTVGVQNCGVIVRIRTRGGLPFKGFLLQARSRMPDGQLMYVGEFRYLNGQPITPRQNNFRQGGMFNGGAQFQGLQQGPQAMGQVQEPVALGQVQGFNPRMVGQQGMNNVIVQRLMCPRGFTVTHTENNPKNMVSLIWYPPAGFNRPIMFKATVVQNFRTYWMGHSSRRLNARANLATAAAMTGRWFSGATKATPSIVIFLTFLTSLLMFFRR